MNPENKPQIPGSRQGGSIPAEPRKPSLVELLNSWEPLDDKDAMPEIDDLEAEPFDL
jgi:hypothetical protein